MILINSVLKKKMIGISKQLKINEDWINEIAKFQKNVWPIYLCLLKLA